MRQNIHFFFSCFLSVFILGLVLHLSRTTLNLSGFLIKYYEGIFVAIVFFFLIYKIINYIFFSFFNKKKKYKIKSLKIFKIISVKNLILLSIILLSLFINTYRQNDLMLFIGDAARDFLAARDAIITHQIPIVGIPSSVIWLHQGPTSVYFIAVALLVSNFNPVAPGIMFGIIGAITTALVYWIGKIYFNSNVGLISGLIYAVSPIIVINARMPYHTSLIPLFATILFISVFYTFKKTKLIILTAFLAGLLLLVELSNIVVIPIVFAIFYIYKKRSFKRILIWSIPGFLLGILPFIMYDFLYGPAYIKFPLWILNRARLFFGLTLNRYSTISSLPQALMTTYQEIIGSILPQFPIVSIFILLAVLFFLVKELKKKNTRKYFLIIVLWLFIPLILFMLHAAPGLAYYGLIYPPIAIILGSYLSYIIIKYRIGIFLLVLLVVSNISLLLNNDFFVSTKYGANPLPPLMYNFGPSWRLSETVVDAILKDAKGRSFVLKAAGGLADFKTSIDPYRFLIWKKNGKEVLSSKLIYVIYRTENEVPRNSSIIHQSYGGIVIKYE